MKEQGGVRYERTNQNKVVEGMKEQGGVRYERTNQNKVV